MELQHLEDQVVHAEERALNISLLGPTRLEDEELLEAWTSVQALEEAVSNHNCRQGQALMGRLASVKAELEAARFLRDYRGKGSLPPVAA